MKRRWNMWLWVGFLLVLAGLLSYVPVFALFPLTRDFPWVNLLMLAAGLALLSVGLGRAFRKPRLYRGRIFGTAMMVLSVAGAGLFCWGTIYLARQLPASAGAPKVGQRAPVFTLPDQDGKPVALAGLLSGQPTSQPDAPITKSRGALLIFYRGYW